MSEPYEERIDGEPVLRPPPRPRHDEVCRRLHAAVAAALGSPVVVRLLAPRTALSLAVGTIVRPDLAVITAANRRLWLAAEVVDAPDHHCDTVLKKALYEDLRVPRLWMVDLRYDNVEVYHGTPHGLMLKGMLAGRECLAERLMPGLSLSIHDLFGVPAEPA